MDQVSIGKTKLVPRSGPGRAGFAVKKSDGRIVTKLDSTQTERPLNTDNVKVVTAAVALTIQDSGSTVIFNSTTSLVATLPAPAAGAYFYFYNKAAAGSGAGHSIATKGSAEKVYGKGVTAAAGKGMVNTQATGAIGDAIEFTSDGTDWFSTVVAGTWARAA